VVTRVTTQLINALHKSQVNPYNVVKLSGIGCSSKTPNYFLSKSQGFNSIHGRMAALATGVHMAHKNLKIIGISGDGDTASIGLGSFIHLVRRNIPMLYIVENNGVYGLTKGQLSATADEGTVSKSGETSHLDTIDLCALAIECGAHFVARSFSGDSKQLSALLNLALRQEGMAFIDIISPCITFANNQGSTKSYDYMKTQNEQLQELGFIQPQEEIKVDTSTGDFHEVRLHDGSLLLLKKTSHEEHDYTSRESAIALLNGERKSSHHLTGLFYWDNQPPKNLSNQLIESGLHLSGEETRPSKAVLSEILSSFA
ncbi:2-oxoacid:ferredoxin oxidoreductase subunit beta, partial [bacterium]|nr:2-oxoacid:ferredoxin oxidoreductase subunit beta [bacterium]